jgi:multiple sugar transport system substrate-binding protein
MIRKFRTTAWLIALCIIISSLAACTGQSEPDKQSSSSQQKDSSTQKGEDTQTVNPVKLVVWGGVPPEMGPQDVCDEFMKLNPNIKVEYVRYVNDDQGNLKLDSALMSGEQIDCYFTYFEDLYVKRIEGGVAEDLTPWLEKEKFDMVENYGEGYWTYKDRVYGLPTNFDFQFVFINKSMFEEAGISIPTEWSWEEYREITKKLTKTENGKQVYGGFMNWQDVGRYVLRGAALGADSFYKGDTESNFEHPIFKRSLELFSQLMIEDKSHISFSDVNNAKLTPYGELLAGKAATCISAPWIMRYINDTQQYPHDFIITAAPLPYTEKGSIDYAWPGLTSLLMMNSKSKSKEEAYKFIKYFGTDGQLLMCRAGKVPSWKKINQDEALKRMMGDNPEQRYDIDTLKRVIFATKVKAFANTKFKGLPQLERIWKEEVEKMLAGQQNIDSAIKNAKQRGDQAIKSAQ